MTQRSILAGRAPKVIIHAGGDVEVEGRDSDRVVADTESRWGLKVEQRSESEIGRARAAVGDHVLFDVRLKVPNPLKKNESGEVTAVQIGGSGRVHVPLGSSVKIYAGKNVTVRDIQGSIAAYAGGNVYIRKVHILNHASCGGALDFECETVEGDAVKFAAGLDLRCYIRNLTDARLVVHDLGDRWEAIVGQPRVEIELKCGGDAVIVTDQELIPQPPYYVLGTIERPTRMDQTAGLSDAA